MLIDLFSQNFMRCLINHVSHEDRFLHRAADRCIKSILQAAEKDTNIITTILPRLISDNGVYNFDQVTKTKTVDKLLSQIEGDRSYELIINGLVSPVKTIKT
jgi:DNA polymerase phi